MSWFVHHNCRCSNDYCNHRRGDNRYDGNYRNDWRGRHAGYDWCGEYDDKCWNDRRGKHWNDWRGEYDDTCWNDRRGKHWNDWCDRHIRSNRYYWYDRHG